MLLNGWGFHAGHCGMRWETHSSQVPTAVSESLGIGSAQPGPTCQPCCQYARAVNTCGSAGVAPATRSSDLSGDSRGVFFSFWGGGGLENFYMGVSLNQVGWSRSKKCKAQYCRKKSHSGAVRQLVCHMSPWANLFKDWAALSRWATISLSVQCSADQAVKQLRSMTLLTLS